MELGIILDPRVKSTYSDSAKHDGNRDMYMDIIGRVYEVATSEWNGPVLVFSILDGYAKCLLIEMGSGDKRQFIDLRLNVLQMHDKKGTLGTDIYSLLQEGAEQFIRDKKLEIIHDFIIDLTECYDCQGNLNQYKINTRRLRVASQILGGKPSPSEKARRDYVMFLLKICGREGAKIIEKLNLGSTLNSSRPISAGAWSDVRYEFKNLLLGGSRQL